MQKPGARRPQQGGSSKASQVRLFICLGTVALLGIITYWNVQFVLERSHRHQAQDGWAGSARPNHRYRGASEVALADLDDVDGDDADLDDIADAAAKEADVPTNADTSAHDVGVSAGGGDCPGDRRPYHTLLTAQSTTYQNWQSRIMYFHWKKQKAAGGPCGEMGGFTRLVAHKKGEPDGLEGEIPSVFVTEYTPAELARFKHFAVMNRPFSVKQMLASPEMMARITEDYIMIAETDHMFLRPLPNLATKEKPVAYNFGYMHASARQQPVIDQIAPGVKWQAVQPIGPSPAILHLDTLRKLTDKWNDYSIALKLNDQADKMFGWVLEMWGYSIAAADLGIVHEVLTRFQCEPGAQSRMTKNYVNEYYIHHYTYGSEYRLDGQPQGVNQIGEWSLDKRHYGGAYPPRNLQAPPDKGHSASNYAPRWLCDAWNEASANIPDWPATKALGTIGWRREAATPAQISASPLASAIVGTKWAWGGVPGLVFGPNGALTTPWSTGKWGILPPSNGSGELIFCDFSNALHNIAFDLDAGTFVSSRVGDGEEVRGSKVQA